MPISYSKQIYSNNATTTLANDLAPGDSVLSLTESSMFPTPGANEYFLVTLDDGVNLEVVAAFGKSGRSLTGCLRGQEGTTARSYLKGTKVECRVTAGTLSSMLKVDDILTPTPLLSDLVSPVATNKNSYVVGELDSAGSPLTALAASTVWAFPSYPVSVHSGAADNTATTTSVAYSGNAALQGLYTTKGLIIQFTSGAQRGACRFVSAISATRISWATPLAAAPGLTDTFQVYQSVSDRLSYLNSNKASLDGATFTGNVGIGVAPSSSRLEVSNGANSNGAFKVSATGTAAGNFASMNFVTGTAVWTAGTEASNGRFFIYNNAASRDQLSFSGGANSDVTLTAAGTGTFRFNTGSTERLRIDTNGNLGIGTTTPSAQGLSVLKSGATDAGVQVGNGTASTYLTQSADGNFYLYNYGAYGLIFGTSGVEKMRLDASGNLGLGVTPSAWSTGKAVEIGAVGNSIFGPSANEVNFTQNAFFNAGWKYGSTQTAGRYQMQGGAHQWFTAPSGTAGAAITFTQAMTLDTNGNLGIRTTPTNYAGSGYNSIAINGTTGGILEFQGAGTQAARITGWSNSLSIHTNNVERLRVDSSGNLALGATSTSARMLVQGSGAQDTMAVQHAGTNHSIITVNQSDALGTNPSYRPILSLRKGGTTSFNLSADGTTQGITYYEAYSATAAHVFVTNSSEKVRIDSAGNLLVGRTTQSSGGKLEVAGNIVANIPTTAPTLGTNSDMSFQLVSNTSLKILVRGSDGVTRSATLTLA